MSWFKQLQLFFVIFFIPFLITPSAVEARQKKVVFDEGHGQRFLIDGDDPLDLSKLSLLFKEEGFAGEKNQTEITVDMLTNTDALVVSGAFVPFTDREIEAVTSFVKEGGRLCVMLHISMPLVKLFGAFDVLASMGVVHEQENMIDGKETDFHITDLKPHKLLEGIKRFSVYGGWALLDQKENAQIIAQTSQKAWIDINRNNKRDHNETERNLGLIVTGELGNGSFVFFGDDAIFQNRFLDQDNTALGKNLARWLGGADKD